MHNLPLMLPIKKVLPETPSHVTLFFEHSLPFVPGQFVMLWLPRVDEKPFTVSYWTEQEFGLTIETKGKFTKLVSQMKAGEMLGIRGPYGRGFDSALGDNVAIVAGGCGMAAIASLIETLVNQKKKLTIIHGARNKDLLLYRERFTGVHYCTDDGSYGHKGFVTTLLEQQLSESKFDAIYTCGPEVMMNKVVAIAREAAIPCQASLERYMRCGFGICGACVCGKQRVCVDGPVFNSDQLLEMSDFGRSVQSKSGTELPLNVCGA